jgi:hypothetical protein
MYCGLTYADMIKQSAPLCAPTPACSRLDQASKRPQAVAITMGGWEALHLFHGVLSSDQCSKGASPVVNAILVPEW